MGNYWTKTSLVGPQDPKVRACVTGIDLMIFISIFVLVCTIFSVCLRTGSNPADINRFESLTRVDDDAW